MFSRQGRRLGSAPWRTLDLCTSDDDVALAAEAHAKTEQTIVVDPWPDRRDRLSEGGYAPLSYRERPLAPGPTNKPEHGKKHLEGGEAIDALLHAHGAARSKGRIELIRRK